MSDPMEKLGKMKLPPPPEPAHAPALRAIAALNKGDAAMRALESLTPQGSEFHNDIERCVAHVRERFASGERVAKDAIKKSRALAAEVADLKAKLAAAEGALRDYGQHKRDCKIVPDSDVMRALLRDKFAVTPCTCGFAAALASTGAKP